MALYSIKTSFLFMISLALVFPLAFATGDWNLSIFVGVIVTFSFFHKFKQTKSLFGSFLNGILMGVLASLAFWTLNFIDHDHHLRYNYFFIGSFFVLFCIFSTYTYFDLKKKGFRWILFTFNALTLAGMILFLIFTRLAQQKIGWAILFGALLGILFGSILTFIFQKFFKTGLEVFGKVWDYIAVLLRPALIFFTGYLTIGLIYAGIYNLIYYFYPDAFSLPEGQIAFLDFILYAIDTMTTGGNSAVNAHYLLAQTINTFNVFSAIVWMTIILAATIGHSSERFKEISDRHKKIGKKTSRKRVTSRTVS